MSRTYHDSPAPSARKATGARRKARAELAAAHTARACGHVAAAAAHETRARKYAAQARAHELAAAAAEEAEFALCAGFDDADFAELAESGCTARARGQWGAL